MVSGDEIRRRKHSMCRRVIGEIPYKLVLRGSNVVSIDPKGVACPLVKAADYGLFH